MYGVGTFASELLVSEAFVSYMSHDHLKAVTIRNEMHFRRTVIVAEYLFVYIPEQVERLHRDVGAFQAAFEQAPEVLQPVRVNLTVNVAFGMVNDLMLIILVFQHVVGCKIVGVDRRVRLDVAANFGFHDMTAAGRNYVGANLTATFKNPDDWRLVFAAKHTGNAAVSIAVHESRFAADESFVHFDFTSTPAEFHKVFAVKGKPDAMHHEPCGLLGDAKSAANLVGTDSILAVDQHPYGNHPLVHSDCGILKNRSYLDGELLLAFLAEPDSPRRNERVLRTTAAGASHFACRPAQRHRIVESLLRVREKANGFLQRLGKLEFVCHA